MCECHRPPLLPLPHNSTPTYTCPPTPTWTLIFLLASHFLLPSLSWLADPPPLPPPCLPPRSPLSLSPTPPRQAGPNQQLWLSEADKDEDIQISSTTKSFSTTPFLNILALLLLKTFMKFHFSGIFCFLLTHERLSTRQEMLAGLWQARDTDCSEQTSLPASPGCLSAPPSFAQPLETNLILKISVAQKRHTIIFVTQVPRLVGFSRLVKIWGKDIKLEKKNYALLN